MRARSSAASIAPASGRPSRPSRTRPRARSIASSSTAERVDLGSDELRRLDGTTGERRCRLGRRRSGMKATELDYDLPPELIAQRPAERRDGSRLLVYDRATGDVRHRRFADLPGELVRGELVVANDSRVVPARIPIERPRGEVLLLERRGENGLWEGLARPTRRLRSEEHSLNSSHRCISYAVFCL